jgi:hypothetical protein
MDKLKILKEIKVFLGLEAAASPTYTLADGTPIEVSELVLGGTVIVGDGPAPAGEHILSDGQTIVVDENGVITEIRPVSVEVPEVEEMGGDPSAPVTKATIEQMVKDAVKEAVTEEIKSFTTKMKKQDSVNEKIYGLLEEILTLPVIQSDPPKQNFSKTTPQSKTEKFGNILKQFQTIKN